MLVSGKDRRSRRPTDSEALFYLAKLGLLYHVLYDQHDPHHDTLMR
jgi:hypothetical protein